MHVQLPLYRLNVDPAASRSHAAVCSERYAISDRSEFRACLSSCHGLQRTSDYFSNNIFRYLFLEKEKVKTGKIKQVILFVTQERNRSPRYGSRLKMIIRWTIPTIDNRFCVQHRIFSHATARFFEWWLMRACEDDHAWWLLTYTIHFSSIHRDGQEAFVLRRDISLILLEISFIIVHLRVIYAQ